MVKITLFTDLLPGAHAEHELLQLGELLVFIYPYEYFEKIKYTSHLTGKKLVGL